MKGEKTMTIYEFLYFCADEQMLTIEIYDLTSGKSVFCGEYDDIPDDLIHEEISTWDVPTKADYICFNITL